MKKTTMLLVVCMLAIFSAGAAFAKTVYLAGEAWIEVDSTREPIEFIWKFSDQKDMWANNHVAFCPDLLRENCDPNVPFSGEKLSADTYGFKIPKEVIAGGQSAFNLANDDDWLDALWLGLPDCQRLHLGKDLVFYKSIADPNIPKSGGMHILYVGPGAPFVPNPNDPRLYTCGSVSAPMATPVAKKEPCKVTIYGDKARTEVLKSIIESYWPAQVNVESGTGHEVTVVGNGGKRIVPISDKLLGQLRKLMGNPNAGDSLNSLCPEQARLLREAIKCS